MKKTKILVLVGLLGASLTQPPHASAADNTAFGDNIANPGSNVIGSDRSTAVGYNNQATNLLSTALGASNRAEGNSSTAVGSSNQSLAL